MPSFEGMADETIEECAAMFHETQVLRGSGLAREGEFADEFFVVLEG